MCIVSHAKHSICLIFFLAETRHNWSNFKIRSFSSSNSSFPLLRKSRLRLRLRLSHLLPPSRSWRVAPCRQAPSTTPGQAVHRCSESHNKRGTDRIQHAVLDLLELQSAVPHNVPQILQPRHPSALPAAAVTVQGKQRGVSLLAIFPAAPSALSQLQHSILSCWLGTRLPSSTSTASSTCHVEPHSLRHLLALHVHSPVTSWVSGVGASDHTTSTTSECIGAAQG